MVTSMACRDINIVYHKSLHNTSYLRDTTLVVKGPQRAPKAQLPKVNNGKPQTEGGVRSAGDDVRDLLYPEEMKKGLFPKNPEQPLINPLREPERWKAYDKASRADFDARIRKDKADEILRRMDEDLAFSKAEERILKEEKVAIYKASEKNHKQAQKAFEKIDKRYGVKDFNESQKKIQEDPKYEKQVQSIVDNYWKKMHKVGQDAHRHAYDEMLKEVEKFQKRQAQQERGGKQ
jgi:hypothetical protein